MDATAPSAYERTREHFPAIYLTLHSIIIALVLERLLEWMWALDSLPAMASADGALFWLQAVMYATTAFMIWLHTTLFGSSVPRVLTPRDGAAPFALLFIFSGMLATMGSAAPHRWFYLACLLAVTAYPAWRSWERAHADDPGSPLGIGAYRSANVVNGATAMLYLLGGVLTHAAVIGEETTTTGAIRV